MKAKYERYELESSPLFHRPTQRQLAELVDETRDELRRLINYKEQFIVRRTEMINGKARDLAYPVSRLRAVHERFKFHLNKIKQPNYLYSPRKSRSQRDNAKQHIGKSQYLSLDLRQFYPSTSHHMVRQWCQYDMRMYPDVAGMFVHLTTIDGKVSFGSPLTPVLCSLIHRSLFDGIAEICHRRGLSFSVWVDDLTISGRFVPGLVLNEIRQLICNNGLRSHKIAFRTGNRPVYITGIGVVGRNLVSKRHFHDRLRELWQDFYSAETLAEKDLCAHKVLAQLGTLRYIVGAKTKTGHKVAGQMNSVRQKREKAYRDALAADEINRKKISECIEESDMPF